MPAHNEQDYLEAAVLDVVTALRDRGAPFEVIVAENGSTDDTAGLARTLAQRWAEVRVISAPRADYGEALRAGFLEARRAAFDRALSDDSAGRAAMIMRAGLRL